MTRHLVTAAAAVTRAWTYVYTLGMPALFRDARRREVACDLFECIQDATQRGERHAHTAMHLLARVALGAIDDLTWRFEHMSIRRHAHIVEFAIAAIVVVIIAVASLVYEIAGADQLPTPPSSPRAFWSHPPPPPPPAPPPPPPGTR